MKDKIKATIKLNQQPRDEYTTRAGAPRRLHEKMRGANLAFSSVAERTGLEPATSGVTGRHSNQLNYRSGKVVGAAGIEPATLAL